MSYLVPGLYTMIPQLDAAAPKDADKNATTPDLHKGQLGYHLRPAPHKVAGADDKTTVSTSATDPTGWRNYVALERKG